MGIIFHRRAERSNCNSPQFESANVEQSTCLPEDPRQQFAEIEKQRSGQKAQFSDLPGQIDLPPAAPSAELPNSKTIDATPPKDQKRIDATLPSAPLRDLPALTLTDQRQRTDGPLRTDTRTNIREVPPPPLPDPELAGVPSRDLYQYADTRRAPGNRQVPPPPLPADDLASPARTPQRREVPPPPLPADDLANPAKRDLYQYSDGKAKRTERDVPPPPKPYKRDTDLPQLPSDVPARPGQIRDIGPIQTQEDYQDHPGPGSRHRRTLREQLNLPARQGGRANRDDTDNSAPLPSLPALRPEQVRPGQTRPEQAHPEQFRPNSTVPGDRLQPPPERPPVSPRPGDGRVTDISAAQLKQLMASSDRPILVDVWKENCGGCSAIAPTMDRIADRYRGQASVYRIHAQEFMSDPELRRQFRFNAVPTTLMFDNGKLINQQTGAMPPKFYEDRLNASIAAHRQSDNRYNPNNPYNPNNQPSESNDQRPYPPQRPNIPERNRVQNDVEENANDRHHSRLDARLQRIKEKISRLTHFTSQEREQAFEPTSAEERTLELINNERRRYRLPDLVHDPRLQMIANRHTDYQVRHGMMHTEATPGWQNVSQRMKQVGLEGWRENAGSGAFTPETLVRMWMNSPGHRAAILGTGNIGAVCIRNGKATFNLTTDPELRRA